MQYNAKAPYRVETHYKIDAVIDADSIYVVQEFTRLRKEIRLYGLDAPEVHINRKMKQDEEKSRLPSALLLQYGLQSREFLLQVAPIGTRVTILTEVKNELDYWKRQLGYIILPNGECLNEVLLMNGYAKASRDYYCSKLPEYQLLNRQAQISKVGLYGFVGRF
ncbi:MAG: hypothetical protein BGO09_12075 [Bacteroidetes bacterium 47-18]|nr:MAG: hypothetical protein BGO09_12075 [Bacteroidetes bacterium 47-18]